MQLFHWEFDSGTHKQQEHFWKNRCSGNTCWLEEIHWERGVEMGASDVAQAALGDPASPSQVLGSQACSTTSMRDRDLQQRASKYYLPAPQSLLLWGSFCVFVTTWMWVMMMTALNPKNWHLGRVVLCWICITLSHPVNLWGSMELGGKVMVCTAQLLCHLVSRYLVLGGEYPKCGWHRTWLPLQTQPCPAQHLSKYRS